MSHEVFISHSTLNKRVADAVCETLEANGIPCWIAPRNVPGGGNYAAEITRGIRNTKIIVFVFSKESNESQAVQRELERAFNSKKIIIPFRIDEVEASDAVDFLIASSQRIDAIRGRPEEHLPQLLKAVEGQLGRTYSDSRLPQKENKPQPKRSRSWAGFAIAAMVLLAVIVAGIFSYRALSQNTGSAVVLEGPDNGAVIVGDDVNANLILRYQLPDKLNRKAEIEIASEDGKTRTVTTSGNSHLVSNLEGKIRWRIRASWTDSGGPIKAGPWSDWRLVEFDSSRLSRILRIRKCVIGTADLSPDDAIVNYDPATNKPGGYEVDLLALFFADEIKKRNLPGEVSIAYKPAPRGWGDDYFHTLEHNPEVDMLVSGITPTAEREKAWGVKFSEPSIVFCSALLVRTGAQGLREGEIVPNVIGVADKTTNKDFLVRLFGLPHPRVYVDPGPNSYDSMIARLRSESIDAILLDEIYIPTLEKHHPELAAETDVVRLSPQDNPTFEQSSAAYVLRPLDGELLRKLNRFLENNLEVRERLREKVLPKSKSGK